MTQDRPSEHQPARPDPGSPNQPRPEEEVNAKLDEASSLAAELVQDIGPPDADDELRRNEQNLAEPRHPGGDRARELDGQLGRMEQLLDTAAKEVGEGKKVPEELLARFLEGSDNEGAGSPDKTPHGGAPDDAKDAMTGPVSEVSTDLPDFMSDLTAPEPEENQRLSNPPGAFHNDIASAKQPAGNAAPPSDGQARPATEAATSPIGDSQRRKPTNLDDLPSEITLSDMASLEAAAAALGGSDEQATAGPGGPEYGADIEGPVIDDHEQPSQQQVAGTKTPLADEDPEGAAPGRYLPRLIKTSAMLIGPLFAPALSLCSRVVAALEWLDRPLANLDLRIKTVIGWAALATLATSLVVITLSMF
jgi:hypothetical protein